MILVKCTRIPGNPKHTLATCEKRKTMEGKQPNGCPDPWLEKCLICLPEIEMETVEFDTGGIIPPVLHKKCKKRAVKPKIQESIKEEEMKKVVFVCKECGEKTDEPGKFIVEKGFCRKCYMKDYYKKNPKKTGSKLAPKKSRQDEDMVEKLWGNSGVVTPDRKVLDIPVKDLTLKDVVKVGGEVRIVEKKDATKEWTSGGECSTERMREAAAETEKRGIKWVEGMKEFFGPTEDQVVVDFARYPDLLDSLREMATEEFRTVEGQLLSLANTEMSQRKEREGLNAEC